MTTIYSFPSHYEDDISDSLSSAGTKSTSYESLEEQSSQFLQLSEMCDTDTSSNATKTIRKKRCAYDKIDDEKRVKLLEAVQKCGESLKSAAKRLKINYSSAKSILHTFRKDGRILKKSPLEGANKPASMSNLPCTMDVSPMGNAHKNIRHRYSVQGSLITERGSNDAYTSSNGPNSPMRGLTSIFANLMIENEDGEEGTSILSTLINEIENEEPISIPKLQLPVPVPVHVIPAIPQLKMQISVEENREYNKISIPKLSEITEDEPVIFVSHVAEESHTSPNPLDLLKTLDNFYMNYSNSPLSGGKGMYFGGDCSDSGSRKYCGREFDSFSDMMNAFQTQAAHNDEMKGLDLQAPSFMRFNSNQSNQDKEFRLTKQDSTEPSCFSGNNGFESYMSLTDAQWLFSDSVKKTAFFK